MTIDANAQREYQAALDQGRFQIQHCSGCGHWVFHPRELCPHCGAAALAWQAPGGLGTVYSTTTVRRKAEAGGDLNVALVDLDEGVRMMSRVEGVAPDAVRIGLRVRGKVRWEQGRGLVVFELLQDDAR